MFSKRAAIAGAVIQRRMPPWFADPHYGKFANDRHLSTQDKATLLTWIERLSARFADRVIIALRQSSPGLRTSARRCIRGNEIMQSRVSHI
jgi:hypothetical protein